MRRTLSVLVVLAGLGCSISFGQSDRPKSPFSSHIADVRAQRSEPALVRFAEACGVHLAGTTPRLASDGGEGWKVVTVDRESFGAADSDLVNTAEVWTVKGSVVVELWGAALDVGSFGRTMYCFDTGKSLRLVDRMDFQVPEDEAGAAWGMHERWRRGAGGKFIPSIAFEFIGQDEKPIPTPKLEKDDRQLVYQWKKDGPKPITVRDLKLPSSLLK